MIVALAALLPATAALRAGARLRVLGRGRSSRLTHLELWQRQAGNVPAQELDDVAQERRFIG
jgi:hypothetical protein